MFLERNGRLHRRSRSAAEVALFVAGGDKEGRKGGGARSALRCSGGQRHLAAAAGRTGAAGGRTGAAVLPCCPALLSKLDQSVRTEAA